MGHGLGDGWSNTQHPLLRLLSTTPSGTANTSQCDNRGNAHGVAEDDSPQRTSAQLVRVVAQQSSCRTSPSTFSSQRFCRQMAARSPSAGRAPYTVSCSPDADTDGSPCSRRSPWRTARHWGPRRAPASDRQRRLSIATPCPFSFSLMIGHALKQSNAMVISPSCSPPQDVPPSASGTARQPLFSATESGDTPRRWGQGGVQQGEETGSVSRVPSALTTAAGTERTSRPVQIHPWLECY